MLHLLLHRTRQELLLQVHLDLHYHKLLNLFINKPHNLHNHKLHKFHNHKLHKFHNHRLNLKILNHLNLYLQQLLNLHLHNQLLSLKECNQENQGNQTTIDGEGVSQKLKVKVRDAHNLPTGLRVVVNYDDNFQPIGEASGLLAGVCGQLAANHVLFPISFEKWSTLPDTYKDTVWESVLKSRFCFKVNEDLAKRDVMFKIGKLWREYRCKLWNEFYDLLMSRSDLIKNVPAGLNMEQWAVFVDYRLRPSTVNMCNRNRDIRKRQIIPHTGGAMSLSRRRNNLKIETGKNIGRAEMWKITHKRKNGIYVNEEALEIGILSLRFQPHGLNLDSGSNISPEDPIGVIFGKEHPGRVRGLSYGACPSLAFKGSTTRLSGMNHASSSSTSSNVEDKITQMENELATVKNQMNTLLAYIASRKDVPEHFAAIAANLVHASTNEL
ncbi:uncharacterized protein [Phaseolus vulgaris]|uniref:uncharacterized protein n=1 Tax=Phaseolus vulgaris TaxID=3885 RepID=UPI0035CA2DAC